MFLMDLHERLKKKPNSQYNPGTVDKVFEYNNRCAKDESGILPEFIKPTIEESKKKKSIN